MAVNYKLSCGENDFIPFNKRINWSSIQRTAHKFVTICRTTIDPTK